MSDKIKNLKEKVYKMLEKSEKARNDDIHLQFMLIHHYYPDGIKQDENGVWWISRRAATVFQERYVARLRGVIQNEEGLFLPTDPAVMRRRKINEETWHYAMLQKDQWSHL